MKMTSGRFERLRLSASSMLCVGAAALLTSCGGVPPPTNQLANAQSAIDQAQGYGAQDLARADLANATDKFNRANAAVKAGDNALATQLADESAVDAQLAAARTRLAKTDRAVADMQANIKTLRDEISRNSQ